MRYLTDMRGVERVTIVTDDTMTKLGYVDKIMDVLNRRENRVQVQLINTVRPEPRSRRWRRGAHAPVPARHDHRARRWIADGCPKVMWLLYEHPEIEFSDMREVLRRAQARVRSQLGKLASCLHSDDVGTGNE